MGKSILVGLLLLPWLLGCGSGEPGKAWQILVVSAGSLGPNSLDGLDAAQYPNLDAWRRSSTTLAHLAPDGDAIATLVSMWTGLRATEHGVAQGAPMPAGLNPLAAYLADHGYNTGASMPGMDQWLPDVGLNRGFGEYQLAGDTPDAVAGMASLWIASHKKQPFFHWVQLPLASGAADLAALDAALGELMRRLGEEGLLERSMVVLTALQPAGESGELGLWIKYPGKLQAARDERDLEACHMPQLILSQAALPVAAVRPTQYLNHPLPAPTPAHE
ncbi:MAG: hypothetical protein R3F33_03445 [Planctomycetota bacterium]